LIQAKKKPVIQKGAGFSYSAEGFSEHKIDYFFVTEDPQQILDNIQPFEVDGRQHIVFDTETHPHYASSHIVPPEHVRRWVGTGKQAIPQDFPFLISICDGRECWSMFDSAPFNKFRALAPLLENPKIEKIAHNMKFDMHMLANADVKLVGRLHDTVVLAKLADENRKSFQLVDLAAKWGIVKFEYMVDNYKQVHRVKDYRHFPAELITEYANADVWNCYHVFMKEYVKCKQDELLDLYFNEMELMMCLYAMERIGMTVDADYETPLKEGLQQACDEAESSVYEEAGEMFNMNSGAQLHKVLLKLGVNPDWIPMTAKGNPSLDKDSLNMLAEKHDVSIVKKVLEYRKNEKLLNTYAVGIYDQRDSAYRVHGSINQTEATTGRMSITKPALQTLPKKDKRIRKCFVPDEDYELWFMDLDQIEYRLFAHYAKAKGLLEAIDAGYDVHQATGAIIFHKNIEDVTDEERQKAKTTNFALIYGQGNEHTAQMLGMTMTETIEFKANYFAQIPEAKPFIMTVHEVIKMRGFVKNFYGRRRRLIRDDCYKAPNALIQGCAADYIKHKLIDMYKYICYHGLRTNIINIVHDEVVLAVHKDELEHLGALRWVLSDFRNFRCNITAGCSRGLPSWGEKEERPDIDFIPQDDILADFRSYDVFDGHVFDIYNKKLGGYK